MTKQNPKRKPGRPAWQYFSEADFLRELKKCNEGLQTQRQAAANLGTNAVYFTVLKGRYGVASGQKSQSNGAD
jgi:hypothetical protein